MFYGDSSMSIDLHLINGYILNKKIRSVIANLNEQRKYLKSQNIRFREDSVKAVNSLKAKYYNIF